MTDDRVWTPPPNWPRPPAGFVPPPDWRPDLAWGPAPAGWEFWQPAGEPTPRQSTGRTQPTPPRRTWLSRHKVPVMTGVAGLILGLVISPGASSDDQQLEDAVAKAETRAQRLAGDVEDKEALLAEAGASEERAVADALADQKTQQAEAVKVAVAAERTRQNARLKKAVAQARAKERDKIESAAPTVVDAEDETDPQFDTCAAANAAGYGNYRRGVDPEYDWYDDRDNDGVVCE